MPADIDPPPPRVETEIDASDGRYLWTFKLYETQSNFYLIGREECGTFWRILTINRLELSELNVHEDATTYSDRERDELLHRLNEGNKPNGGLRFVTNCYGIVGFVKFLGPYYMLLITERREIGTICGHAIYAISKSRIIAVSNSTMQSDKTDPKNENRYMKLLSTVDLTKDFFFSYTYHVMHSLQKNLSDCQKEQVVDETLFVWNEFLTHEIRNLLKSTIWTVALVYGFFKQEILSVSGKQFKLSLIARRSRCCAGTRYLKRGVNERGNVANDVETEQIVCEDCPGGCPTQVTSIVQNRGSIPLYWSQEASMLNLKPDIVLKEEQNYEATRLHFANLAKRYGNPIIVLNLIKRKPRESKLREEFANAINFINKDSSEENVLGFIHWDLNKKPRRKACDVLEFLGKLAERTLNLTDIFYRQIAPTLKNDDAFRLLVIRKEPTTELPCESMNGNNEVNTHLFKKKSPEDGKPHRFQSGVLRTNCIDCLDRTNVAQYAYGLSALGLQLCALGLVDGPKIDSNSDLANDLMTFYESMGDTLAFQYTGSASHNKIFSERRGCWEAFIQLQEFARTIQRYFSNSYMDAQKQDAINVFLGYFQPQNDKPFLWDLDSTGRSLIGSSLSDGRILHQNSTPASSRVRIDSVLSDKIFLQGSSTCDSYSKNSPTLADKHPFKDDDQFYFSGSDFSNFFDLDRFLSTSNSYEETHERPSSFNSPMERHSSEKLTNGTAQKNPFKHNESNANGIDSNETRFEVGN